MESGSFPSEWKKGNVVPIHKKDNKQQFERILKIIGLYVCYQSVEKFLKS